MVEWQPFRVLKDFDKKTPVCATCKKTNRTRSFCREKHKHRQLPWCTVYVLLSTLDSADPSTIVAPSSKPIGATVSSDTEDSKHPSSAAYYGAPKYRASSESPPLSVKDESSVAESKASDLSESISPGDDAKRLAELGEGDDINAIPESRTMLVKVSTVGTVITWLEAGDDGQLSRRNLNKVLEEHPTTGLPLAAGQPGVDQQHGHDRNTYIWPMAYGMPLPNAAQHPYYHHQLQQRHPIQYAAPGWHFGHPPAPHQQLEYQVAPPPPHHQYTPVQYVPVVQESPVPNTPIAGPNTPIAAASPAAAVTSPAPVTAGEAAAAQRLKRSVEESSTQERRVSQSPSETPTHQQHQQQSLGLPRHQHPHTLVHGLAAPVYPVHGLAYAHPKGHGLAQASASHPQHVPQQPQAPPHLQQHHQQQAQWAQYHASLYHQHHGHLVATHSMQYPHAEAHAGSPSGPAVSTLRPQDSMHQQQGIEGRNVISTIASPSLGKRLPHSFPDGNGDPLDEEEDDENNLNSSKRSRLS
jgi:hypothetical protein